MPTYELSLIYRSAAKPILKSYIKRTAEAVFKEDGIIRKIENLGTRKLPVKIIKDGRGHREGSYILMQFDIRATSLGTLAELNTRDIDIIRQAFFRVDKNVAPIECTLEEELLPSAYRPDVQKMIAAGKAKPVMKFKLNVDHYIFN